MTDITGPQRLTFEGRSRDGEEITGLVLPSYANQDPPGEIYQSLTDDAGEPELTSRAGSVTARPIESTTDSVPALAR